MNEELDDPRDVDIYEKLVKNTLEGYYFQSADSSYFCYNNDDDDDIPIYREIFKVFSEPPKTTDQEKTVNISSDIQMDGGKKKNPDDDISGINERISSINRQ